MGQWEGYAPVLVDEDVLELQVAVHDVAPMDVPQGENQGRRIELDLIHAEPWAVAPPKPRDPQPWAVASLDSRHH